MRNYIQTKLREQLPRLRKEIEDRYEQAASQLRQFTNLTAVRGTVRGNGLISNSFIFGEVIIEEGAEMINCTVDTGVTVILHKGAKVFNCRFKGIQTGSYRRCHYTVVIGEDCIVLDSSMTISTTLGKNGRYCRFATGWGIDFERSADGAVKGDKPAMTVGENAFACDVYLWCEGLYDTELQHLVIGNDAILIDSQLRVSDKAIIGAQLIMCDYDLALQLAVAHGRIQDQQFHAAECDYEGFIASTSRVTTTRFYFDMEAGTNLYIGTPVIWHNSYPKLKTPQHIQIDNNVIFVGQNSDHRIKACTHDAVIGDNTTIVGDANAQYGGAQTLRSLRIGSNSCVIWGTVEHNFSGTDKFVRSNTTTKI